MRIGVAHKCDRQTDRQRGRQTDRQTLATARLNSVRGALKCEAVGAVCLARLGRLGLDNLYIVGVSNLI